MHHDFFKQLLVEGRRMDEKLQHPNKNLVVKSNQLVEAGYRLTLQEQRVILFCISKINPGEKLEKASFSISVEDYANTFQVNSSNAYKELRSVIDTLYDRSIKIFDRGANVEAELRWIQDKIYFNNEGRAQITFSAGLFPFISEIKSKFTSYDINHVAGMKSIYAIRLYELFKQFGKFGQRKIELEWLKERLHIADLYTAFADLKKRVIEPAVREINANTDLRVTYKAIKQVRKVVALSFIFSRKEMCLVDAGIKEPSLDENTPAVEKNAAYSETHEEDNINAALQNELQGLGVSLRQTRKILAQYEEERIQTAMEITRFALQKGNIKNVAGFLVNAIREKYESREIVKKQEEKFIAENIDQIELVNRRLESLEKSYEEFCRNYLEKKIEALAETERAAFIADFEKTLDAVFFSRYKVSGLKSGMIYPLFQEYMKKFFMVPDKKQFECESGLDKEVEELKRKRDELYAQTRRKYQQKIPEMT